MAREWRRGKPHSGTGNLVRTPDDVELFELNVENAIELPRGNGQKVRDRQTLGAAWRTVCL
jgi:hypothetical protein